MVDVFGNDVEATFDFVAKTATLPKQQATMLLVASTLLLVWTGLKLQLDVCYLRGGAIW